jgi:hypothetical protein
MVYPLRVDRMIESKLPSGSIAWSVREVGNRVLASRDAMRRREASIEVRSCEDFAVAEAGIEASGGVCLERSAAYLNWRYRDDPRGAVTILCSRRGGEDAGFLVFRCGSEDLDIQDAFAIGDTAVFRELVLEVIEIARSRNAASVTAGISEGHPWMRELEKLGFHRRESAPFFVYARRGMLDPEAPWFLMSGDRD